MTIPIGSMTANFANADIAYTGIGMHVTDYGSSNASKLLHMTVEANSKLLVYKDGGIRIKSNIDPNSNIKLMHITNKDRDIISITSNTITYGHNVHFQNTVFVQSYAEGVRQEYVTNGTITIDLTKASAFRISSNTVPVTINSITILPAVSADSQALDPGSFYVSHSCLTLFDAGITIPDNVWANASVIWAANTKPSMPTSNNDTFSFSTVLTNSTGTTLPNFYYWREYWKGIILGQGFGTL